MYIQPQLQIFQEFRALPQATIANLNAFVFGPNYALRRYANAAMHDDLFAGSYAEGQTYTLAYPEFPGNATIDTGYTRLYMENVRARYAQIAGDSASPVTVKGDGTEIYAAPVVGAVEALDTATGVEFEVGGALTSVPAQLPENLYLYADTAPWAILRSTSTAGLDAVDSTLAVLADSDGTVRDFTVQSNASALQSGTEIAGPYGLAFDFDAPASTTRGVFRIDYTGQPSSAETLTIGATTVTEGTDFDIGVDAASTYAALADALHSGVPEVYDVIEESDAIIVVLADSTTTVTSGLANSAETAVETLNAVRAPINITIAAGSGTLTVAPRLDKMATFHALSVAGNPVKFDYADAAIGGSAFVSGTSTIDLKFEAGDSLADIQAALQTIAADYVTVTGAGDLTATGATVKVGDYTAKASTVLVPDAYKFTVSANPHVFADGNGYSATGDFAVQGVQVGDYITATYTDNGSTVEKKSKVLALAGIPTASSFGEVVGAVEAEAAAGDTLVLNSVGDSALPQVVSGDDNQMSASGANSGVYYLDSDYAYVRADYVNGDTALNFTVRVTVEGVAGTAKAEIQDASGAVVRTGVPILAWADDTAAVELGNNLWMRLDPEVIGVSAIFRIGDTYTLSRDVQAPWSTIVDKLVVSGEYTGMRDTTYVISVVRGGSFTQSVEVHEGLQAASSIVVTEDTGSITLSADGISATGDAAAVETAINSGDTMLRAVADGTAVTITGPAEVIRAVTVTTGTGVSKIAELQASPVWATIGDTDVDYTVACTTGGSLQNARFSIKGSDGFSASNISFVAAGNAVTIPGTGISLLVDTDDAGASATTPTFTVGDSWNVIVNGTRPRIRISDTMGYDQSKVVTVSANSIVAVGAYGLSLKVLPNSNDNGFTGAEGGLLAGDAYTVAAKAAAQGAITVVKLADTIAAPVSGVAITPMLNVKFNKAIASAEVDNRDLDNPGDFTWVSGSENLTVNGNLAILDLSVAGGASLPVESGSMYIEYRALVQDYTSGVFSMGSVDDIVSELGEIHKDNPLAQGMFHAMLNSGDRSVYFTAVAADDLAGYAAALDLAEQTDQVYAFAPTSRDRDIIDATAAHVKQMSGETTKLWRIAITGVDVEDTEEVLSGLATLSEDVDGKYFMFPAGSELMDTIAVGDTIRAGIVTDAWGDTQYDTYTVSAVQSNTVLRVVPDNILSGVVSGLDESVSIVRSLSNPEIAENVAARSGSLASRRVFSVFPHKFTYDGQELTSEFAAAAVAGLLSSMAPQRPLTNVEIAGIGTINALFNDGDLNTMAAGGTLILAQDLMGGRTYVRHQISTQAADGNLLTSEMSITKNWDAISYYMKGILTPFHGRYNITPGLLRAIEVSVRGGLEYLSSSRTGAGLIGPMLLATENTALREVSQHPTLRDHVIVIADLDIPIPNNVTQLRLVV